jgi:hypothetical protein
MKTEWVWGTLNRIIKRDEDGTYVFDCLLLNEPHQDFQVHQGARVLVTVQETANAINLWCLGVVPEGL